MTSAWLATTRRAWRAARTFFSIKQRRKCGQAEWMHSPRRSASELTRARPISSASQPGKSPATRSPEAVAADPARDQHQRRRRLPGPRRSRARRVLVIQQAQEILPPLADHDAAALLRRVRIEPVEFAVDLALQVARVGRQPDRALVLLGPQAGRRDIAQGFPDAGPGLGEHRARRVGVLARARRRRRRRRRNRPVAAGPRRRRRAMTRAAAALRPARPGRCRAAGGGARSCHSGRFCQTRSPAAAAGACAPVSAGGSDGEHGRTPAPAGALGDFGEGAASRCRRRPAIPAAARGRRRSARRRHRPWFAAAAGRARRRGRAASGRRTAPAAQRRKARARRAPRSRRGRAAARRLAHGRRSGSRRYPARAGRAPRSGDSASISPSADSHMVSRNPATSAGTRGTRATRFGHGRLSTRRASRLSAIRLRPRSPAAVRSSHDRDDLPHVPGGSVDGGGRAGRYDGTEDDRRDGFIHFSTAAQLRESARRHRAGQAGLVLVAVEAGQLGDRSALGALARRGAVPASLRAAMPGRGVRGRAAAARSRRRACLSAYAERLNAPRPRERLGGMAALESDHGVRAAIRRARTPRPASIQTERSWTAAATGTPVNSCRASQSLSERQRIR